MSKYDDESKHNAVRIVLDEQSVRSVSQELGVNESQIHKWRRAALGDGVKSGSELSETQELSKRIRELEMENEILKKAALIFGSGS